MTLVLAGVVACKGDPTGDLRNGVDHLIATPGAIFLTPGATTNVLIEAVDEQGNRQGTRFTLDQVSALINVVVDSGFGRVVDNDGNLVFPDAPTRLRFAVSPAAPVGDASFKVRAGGKEITVPVRLVPDSIAVTFSDDSPAPGDTVTITTATPFQLRPNATVDAGGTRAILLSQAGNTLQVVPIPGSAAGPITVNSVALEYATTLNLSLPSTTSFTPPAGFTGADALATAPTITIPAAGSTSLFVDVGTMEAVAECDDDNGAPCRAYKLTLATARTFNVSATWEGTSDLGLYFYNSAGTLLGGFCDGHGNTDAGQPEACTKTLGPGTFYVTVVDFGAFYDPAEAPPAWIRLDLTGQ
jgi:hypothetical protein